MIIFANYEYRKNEKIRFGSKPLAKANLSFRLQYRECNAQRHACNHGNQPNQKNHSSDNMPPPPPTRKLAKY